MAMAFEPRNYTDEELEKGLEFEFEMKPDRFDMEESDEEFQADYTSFKEDIVDVEGKNKPRFLGGPHVAFNIMKEKMEPVTEDGLVLKSIFKHGNGLEIPDKSVVMLHYEAYVEERREPIDSTRLRNKPFKFLIGDGNILLGLELGIKSMKNEEISTFIVAPDYAYGPMGCPPRIPPNAEIMYEVEIINFHTSKDAVEFEDMDPDEQKRAPFEKIVGVYHCENQMAKDLFHRKQFGAAIARYKRVMKLLETVSVQNEEQDKKRQEYLVKLYTNLAQCYINVQNPKKAVTYAGLALKIDGENCKGLYRMGHALHMLSQYSDAMKYLNRAKSYNPNDKVINRLILTLHKKQKEDRDMERIFCMHAMGNSLSKDKERVLFEESPEFVATIQDELKAFVDSPDAELMFSPGYTNSQLDVVKSLAQKLDLAFVSKIQNDKKINKVAKRN